MERGREETPRFVLDAEHLELGESPVDEIRGLLERRPDDDVGEVTDRAATSAG